MTDKKQIATFEQRFRMEVLLFIILAIFPISFSSIPIDCCNKNFGVNLSFNDVYGTQKTLAIAVTQETTSKKRKTALPFNVTATCQKCKSSHSM